MGKLFDLFLPWKRVRRLQSLLDNCQDAIYRMNLQSGRFLYISPAAETLTGYSLRDLMALDTDGAVALIHPDDRPAVRAALLESEQVGHASVEYRQRTRDGGYRWFSNYMSLVRDRRGCPLYRDGNIRDISERKQSEEALRQSEKMYRILHETLWDAFVQVSMDGRVIACNDLYCRMLGYTPEEIREQTYLALTPERWHAAEEKIVREQVLPRGFSDLYEKEYRRKDGSVFPVELRTILLRDEDGRAIAMWGIIRDITERKKAEERLRRSAQDLALSNRELQQFAYIVSHDLQEPLRMVSAFSGLLQDRCCGKLDSQSEEYIAFVQSGAARMQALIADLLAYSHVGSKPEKPAAIHLDGPLDAALDNLKASVDHVGAKITREPLPAAVAEGPPLTQLFQNLIGNAIKYRNPKVPPEIHVGAAPSANGFVTFFVRDNGIGIDPAYHDRIFEIFQRLHTQDQYEGTGIGLAICKKIVERQGGRIWVESTPGQGATFFFTLPSAHHGQ